ncbi:MAG: hypothetical protein R2795_16230 [Saprospiraceae bacterium]
MTMKSILGYVLAFALAILVWQLITRLLDKKFITNPITPKEKTIWTALQWGSTGFLWTQWLIQDFANIYVYLPRQLSGTEIAVSLSMLLIMLGYIFYSRGGSIQQIVKAKTNTVDIRSATIIDFLYAIILLFFKEFSNVPMSTTWVFLGLLAGREIAIRYQLEQDEKIAPSKGYLYPALMGVNLLLIGAVGYTVFLKDAITNPLIAVFAGVIILSGSVFFLSARQQALNLQKTYLMVGKDLGKITFGLVVSIALVFLMRLLTGGELAF